MIRFVTGTDTGVGKTVVSAMLCARARAQGRRVAYCKPIQTGDIDGSNTDAAFVARAVPGIATSQALSFVAPLAPAEAAIQAGTSIDVAEVVAFVRAAASEVQELIVEGAGGLLVPITEEYTMADLALELGARLIVVARPGLGTLNHTALTLEAARSRGLIVECVIVSGYPNEPGLVERTNLERLRAMAPLETIPFLDGVDVEAGSTDGMATFG